MSQRERKYCCTNCGHEFKDGEIWTNPLENISLCSDCRFRFAVNTGGEIMPLTQVIEYFTRTFRETGNPYTSYGVGYLEGKSTLAHLHAYAELKQQRT